MWNWILSLKSHRAGWDSESQWFAWDGQWERLNYGGESVWQLSVQDFLLLLQLWKGSRKVPGVHGARGRRGRQPDPETSPTEVQETGGSTGGDQPGDHQQQAGGGRETEDGGKFPPWLTGEEWSISFPHPQIIQERAKSARSSSARMKSLPAVKGQYQVKWEEKMLRKHKAQLLLF